MDSMKRPYMQKPQQTLGFHGDFIVPCHGRIIISLSQVYYYRYMLFRLQNLDPPGVTWKIFRNKDLLLSKSAEIVLGQLRGPSLRTGTRFAAPIRDRLSRKASWVSVMFDTDVCDDKKARQIAIVGTLGIPLIAENAMRRAPGPLTCADTFSRYSNDYFFLPGATGSAQLVVPPAVSAPRVAGNCGLHATSGWGRFPLMLLTPAKRANDRSCRSEERRVGKECRSR